MAEKIEGRVIRLRAEKLPLGMTLFRLPTILSYTL
jgi:hypothetical protein